MDKIDKFIVKPDLIKSIIDTICIPNNNNHTIPNNGNHTIPNNGNHTIIDKSNITDTRILLGKNAETNWQIYKASSQTDCIFHLDKLSSPYVIVNIPADMLTTEQIYIIGSICKSKSKHKNVPNISVMYTPISNTMLGNNVGEFIITSNRKKNTVII